MSEGKLEVPADIYLYPGKDDELIEVYESLGRFAKKPILLGLAEVARKREWVSMKDLYSKASDEGVKLGEPILVRLKMSRPKNQELINVWEQVPRGLKSPLFIAFMKASLKAFGENFNYKLLMRDGDISDFSSIEEVEEIVISDVEPKASSGATSLANSLMSSSMNGMDLEE